MQRTRFSISVTPSPESAALLPIQQNHPNSGLAGEIPKPLSRNVFNIQVLSQLGVPTLVINRHPSAERQGQYDSRAAESGCGGKSRDLLGRVLVAEDVGRDNTHHVRNWHADRGE